MKKNHLKRNALCALALMTLIALCALALGETAVSPWTDACEELLFHTRNVTLDGEAEFRLDGAWFKTAVGHYVQDGMNSLWNLALTTPREDDWRQETGFTVIANGDNIYVMEAYTPGVYRSGSDMPQSTILRNTVQMNQMFGLGKLLADQLVPLLGDDLTVTDTELRLTVAEGKTPELMNSAMNIFAQFVLQRFFGMDYDTIPADETIYLGYVTPTQEIFYSTRSFTLQTAELVMTKDASGRLSSVDCSAAIRLNYRGSEPHLLEIAFHGAVSDYGTSKVDAFKPAEWGVEPAEDTVPQELMIEGSSVDAETAQWLAKKAQGILKDAGYEDSVDYELMWSEPYKENGQILIVLTDRETYQNVMFFFAEDGTLRGMENPELYIMGDQLLFDEDEAAKAAFPETKEKLLAFLEKVYPQVRERVQDFELTWRYETNGEVYLEVEETPRTSDSDIVMFLIRIAPTWQITQYSTHANG